MKNVRWLVVLLMWIWPGVAAMWVLPPEVKVNPLNGRAVAEAAEFDWKTADLRAGADSLRLYAFPGEWKMIQVVLPQPEIEKVTMTPGHPFNLKIFRVGMVPVTDADSAWLPDPLWPLPQNSSGDFLNRVPAVLFPAAARYQLFWIEIRVDAADKGKTDRFTLEFIGSSRSKGLPVRLTVLNQPLPPAVLELDLNEYGDKYLKAFGRKMTLAEKTGYERQIFQMVHAHGATLNTLPYKSQRGGPRRDMAPVLANQNPEKPQLDWSDFDRRYGDYFSGKAFSDGQPLSHFYLPFNPDWPAPFTWYLNNRERYERAWKAVAAAFETHFREKNWTRTIFQVYCNQKPGPHNRIPWNLDEPKGVDDYRALRYYCDLTHAVFPSDSPIQVKFRIDISHFYCEKHKGSRTKDFRVNGGDRILRPVDIWVISHHSLQDEFPMQQARRLVAEGKQVYEYGNTPIIAQRGADIFGEIYRLWQNRLTGFLAWKTFASDLPVKSGKRFLLYSLRVKGAGQILPSVRFKLLKRALDDTRILELALQHRLAERPRVLRAIGEVQRGDRSARTRLLRTVYRNAR